MGTNYANLTKLERATLKVTNWMGTTSSLIVHTLAFIGIFSLYFVGFNFDQIMLILTTAVSLEAIYLALFIQMTVNRNTASLEEVEEDVEDLETNIKSIHQNVTELAEDIDEIQEDIDEIQEDVEEINEDEETDPHLLYVNKTNTAIKEVEQKISRLSTALQDLQSDISKLQEGLKSSSSK